MAKMKAPSSLSARSVAHCNRPTAKERFRLAAVTLVSFWGMSRLLTNDWDQLSKVTMSLDGAVTRFVYGPDGERIKKVMPLGITLYPDANVEIARDTLGNWIYTRYPHMDVKVVGTAKHFLHRDHLASVDQVTGNTAVVEEDNLYAAFGEMVQRSGNTGQTISAVPPTAKTYIGERFDFDTGLMYLNART
jgi:hypothetical protein